MSDRYGQSNTKKSKPNFIYSIISVALVLFLVGCFVIIAYNANKLVRHLKEQLPILVELNQQVSPEQVKQLQDSLQKLDFVLENSVVFISKETAMKEMQSELGEDFLKFDFQNPLHDMIRFNTKAAFLNNQLLNGIKKNLEDRIFVREVYYQESLVEKVEGNVDRLSWVVMIIGLLLLIVALTLIHNTVKLALYANRFIIKNMELVGATWGFITWPFVRKSIKNGLWSAIIAIFMLIVMFLLLQSEIPGIIEVNDIDSNWCTNHQHKYLFYRQ